MTWNDLICLVDLKIREIGCIADEVDIEFIDSGVFPAERNLDISIEEVRRTGLLDTYHLRIECHS